MDRLEHEVPFRVDDRPLALRIGAPKHKDHVVLLVGDLLDHTIGELLPPFVLVRTRLPFPHAQRGIEQEDALVGPSGKVAGLRERDMKVPLNLLEDIDERRRKLHPVIHGETEPVRLSVPMVRVLTDDDHLHLVERALVESVENQRSRRITRRALVLLPHETRQ